MRIALTKGGVSQLDVEVESLGDPNVKVQDLEDARREIISLSGIPAPQLGFMDTVELREQLVHTNINFATEIAELQEMINRSLNELMDAVAEILNVGYVPSKYIKLGLIPPNVLVVQLIEMTMGSIGSIAGVLQQIGLKIDPYYLIKKYVPHFDIDELKKASGHKELDDTTKQQMGGQPGASQGFGGGGGGMY